MTEKGKRTAAGGGARQPGPNQSRPWTASRLAAFAGVDLKTVHKWARRGLIEHFRTPGGHLRFRRGHVEQFLESGGVRTGRSARSNILAILGARRRRQLGDVFVGRRVRWTSDPLRALLWIGHEPPAVVIVEEDVLSATDARAFIRVVAEEQPSCRLLWTGPTRPPAAVARKVTTCTNKADVRRELERRRRA